MSRGAAVLGAVALLLAACEPSVPEHRIGAPAVVTGTFQSGGIRITTLLGPDGEIQARLVRGSITAVAPVVYEINQCHRLSFETGPPHNIHFSGCAGRLALVGRFRFADGTEQRVYLKRQAGGSKQDARTSLTDQGRREASGGV